MKTEIILYSCQLHFDVKDINYNIDYVGLITNTLFKYLLLRHKMCLFKGHTKTSSCQIYVKLGQNLCRKSWKIVWQKIHKVLIFLLSGIWWFPDLTSFSFGARTSRAFCISVCIVESTKLFMVGRTAYQASKAVTTCIFPVSPATN